MKIGVPKEIHPGESRVATTPDVVKQLIDLGYEVQIESDKKAYRSKDPSPKPGHHGKKPPPFLE